MTPIRVLICGSRGWSDPRPIDRLIDQLLAAGGELVVIHGKAPKGADRLADQAARSRGVKVIREPADWRRYGRAAGPIRNTKMLTDHDPGVVVAFRSSGKSSGTDDMVRQARGAGVPTFVFADGVREQDIDEAVQHSILPAIYG